MAKPNIPIAGATILPDVEASTNKKPMIGPVHENDTNESVKAIKKILINPLVLPDLLSIAVVHDDGRVSSKAPKNEAANATNNKKNRILNTELVANEFNALAPKIIVMANPKKT